MLVLLIETMDRVSVSDNRLRVELTTVNLVNVNQVRTKEREVQFGFAITGLNHNDEPVGLIELVETIPLLKLVANGAHWKSEADRWKRRALAAESRNTELERAVDTQRRTVDAMMHGWGLYRFQTETLPRPNTLDKCPSIGSYGRYPMAKGRPYIYTYTGPNPLISSSEIEYLTRTVYVLKSTIEAVAPISFSDLRNRFRANLSYPCWQGCTEPGILTWRATWGVAEQFATFRTLARPPAAYWFTSAGTRSASGRERDRCRRFRVGRPPVRC